MAYEPPARPHVDMVAKFASINRGAFMSRAGSGGATDNLSEGIFAMDFVSLEKMSDALRNAPHASAMLSTLMQMLGIKGIEGAFNFMQDVDFSRSTDLKNLGIFKGLSRSTKTVLSSAGTNYTR